MNRRSFFLRASLVLLTLVSCAPVHAMQPSGSWNPWHYIKNVSPLITRSLSENRPNLTSALVTGAGLAIATAAIGFFGYSWYTMRTQLAHLTQRANTAEQRARDIQTDLTRRQEELNANQQEFLRLQQQLRIAQNSRQSSASQASIADMERQLASLKAEKDLLHRAIGNLTSGLDQRALEQIANEVLDREALIRFIDKGYNSGSDKRLPAIEAAIKRGGVLFYQIINGQLDTTPLPIDLYLTNIVDLMWYLNEQANIKNQEHDEGTYIFIFKNAVYTERFYNFLFNYVKRVNPEWAQQRSQYVSVNPYGYARLSSHLTKIRDLQRIQHFGIDVRRDFEQWKESMAPLKATAAQEAQQLDRQLTNLASSGDITEANRPGSDGEGWLSWIYQGAASATASAASLLANAINASLDTIKDSYERGAFGTYESAVHELPSGKEHILFFKYTDPVTNTEKLFIKLENHGLALGDVALHGKEYAMSLQRKTNAGEGDDRASWRKERVPKKYAQEVKQWLEQRLTTKPKMPGTIDTFHALNQLPQLARHFDYFKNLLNQARSEYNYLTERTGREIIISELEALGSYYYELQKAGKLQDAYYYKTIVMHLYALHNKAHTLKELYYNNNFATPRQDTQREQQELLETMQRNYQGIIEVQGRLQLPAMIRGFIDAILQHYGVIMPEAHNENPIKTLFEDDAI